MKTLICILALIGYVACSVDNWTQLRIKYGASASGINTEAFFHIQNTIEEALAGSWSKLEVPNELNLQAVAYNGDYGFVAFYDAGGALAGGQIAILVDVITETGPASYDPTWDGTNEIKTFNGKDYYVSSFLLVDPNTLRSGSKPVRTAKLHKGVIGEGLWFRNASDITGYSKIPVNLDQVVSETLYTWQNCLPNMGRHYFYNHTAESDCQKFHSWFLLGQENSVTGFGYQLFGNYSKLVQQRNWYDDVNRMAVQMIVPSTHDCMYEWVEEFGVISLHFYLTPEPWNITCDQQVDSVSPIPGL